MAATRPSRSPSAEAGRRSGLWRTVTAAALLAALSLAGCKPYNRDSYLLSPDTVKGYLKLTAPDTMPADGMTTTTIIVEIPERSPVRLNAVFTATAGTIIGGIKDGKELSVPVDDNGRASIQFRSETDPKTADLVVTVDKLTVTKSIRFESVASSSLFSLSVNPPELPADGFS